MKFVKIERSGQVAEGVLQGQEVTLIGGWQNGSAATTQFTLTSRPLAEVQQAIGEARERVMLAEVELVPPVDPFRKIICVGLNYLDHTTETENDLPANPMLFTRSLDSLVGHEQPIVRPRVSTMFDFEGEIAVIIGREGHHIEEADAIAYVGGYSCFLDGSVRDYQRQSLMTGKNFWRSGSMGPWVVPAALVEETNIALETRLNGTVVQRSRASDMLFGISSLISYCSRWTVLRPGDVIATGTPGGVGARRSPQLWMKPGDNVEVELGGIGILANPVIDECDA
jgi:2-keto-4-pentenoate hydratase/2-oxohepta-3-ene-1,7-dioic acid hydratase in catechol pathway